MTFNKADPDPLTETPDSLTTYVIGDDVIAQTVDGTTQYLLYDGHGSTRQLAEYDTAVTIADTYSYDGYGVLLQDNAVASSNPGKVGAQATNLLYAGEQFDTDAQHYYLRARYYDQNTGRFNRMDPFAGNNQDPQSLHKYLYAHGNPVNNTDPSGFGIGVVIAMVLVYAILWGVHLWDYHNPKENRIRNKFDRWYNRQTQGWWTVLPKCPSNIDVTNPADPKYTGSDQDKWEKPEVPHEFEERLHPGIKFSMRSKVIQGHTNQATYDASGNLFIKYPRAGTVDWRPPFGATIGSRTSPPHHGGGPVTLTYTSLGIAHKNEDVYPLHWAVYLDHGITMSITKDPKTPMEIKEGSYMEKYYEKRPLW